MFPAASRYPPAYSVIERVLGRELQRTRVQDPRARDVARVEQKIGQVFVRAHVRGVAFERAFEGFLGVVTATERQQAIADRAMIVGVVRIAIARAFERG